MVDYFNKYKDFYSDYINQHIKSHNKKYSTRIYSMNGKYDIKFLDENIKIMSSKYGNIEPQQI